MASVVDICNYALLRIGGATIADLSEGSRASELCSIVYEQCRDQLLRAFPWNFARRVQSLADTNSPPTNWGYSYAMPSDCVRPLRIVIEGNRLPRVDEKIPYEVASNGTQRLIYADVESAELEYTARVDDSNLWDASFINALSWLIASEIATPLTANPDYAKMAREAYTVTLGQAMAQNLNDSFAGVEPDCELLTGRL